MTEIFFWILMLLWLIFGGYDVYADRDIRVFGRHLLIWFLFLFVGLKIFGNPLS